MNSKVSYCLVSVLNWTSLLLIPTFMFRKRGITPGSTQIEATTPLNYVITVNETSRTCLQVEWEAQNDRQITLSGFQTQVARKLKTNIMTNEKTCKELENKISAAQANKTRKQNNVKKKNEINSEAHFTTQPNGLIWWKWRWNFQARNVEKAYLATNIAKNNLYNEG